MRRIHYSRDEAVPDQVSSTAKTEVSPAPRRIRPRRIVVLAIVLLAAILWFQNRDATPAVDAAAVFRRAETASRVGSWQRVLDYVSQIPADHELWPASRLLAGRAAEELGQLQQAKSYLQSYPADQSPEFAEAAFLLGEVYRQLGNVSQAEAQYLRVLNCQPQHSAAHAAVGYLMSITGRPWQAVRHFGPLLYTERWTLRSLALLTDPEQPAEHPDYLDYCVSQFPGDPLVRLGLAAAATADGDLATAETQVRAALQENATLPEAQALLGELLLAGEPEQLRQWHQALPNSVSQYPGIWFVRGMYARRLGKIETAAACFAETLRLEPFHRRACFQLGQVLEAEGHPQARDFIRQAEMMAAIGKSVSRIWAGDGQEAEPYRELIDQLRSQGRGREAWAWALTAAVTLESAEEFRQQAVQLSQDLPTDSFSEYRQSSSVNSAIGLDLQEPADIAAIFQDTPAQQPAAAVGAAQASPGPGTTIRFVERLDAGIDSRYHSGADPAVDGVRFFETTGGGVAVLDVDRDRWPDLFFTQGNEWPHGSSQPNRNPAYSDRLFRNRAGTYHDVTQLTGTGSLSYGQGCTVGDLNNDGFDDLYVANIGRNQLYLNQGDGTFTEITQAAGLNRDTWTASVVIADLNADGNPELFDVNYVTADDVYTRICQGGQCGPHAYTGVPDDLYVSRGDGTFQYVAGATPQTGSKGLGVVAAALEDSQRLSLMIANDAVPNFLLHSRPADNAWNLQLVDEAMLSGLAVNDAGLFTGTMGIAAGDADNNGLLDFFVTNFVDEANSLYLQDVPGFFVDSTYAAGLHAASVRKVGWGTQFLDADLDGDEDLVVANGHVDDYQINDQGYEMSPQFFRNDGGGRYHEEPPDAVGPWFAATFLGRGLARIDFNADGRMDFAVTQIGDPASLVQNSTETAGHFLNLEFQATTTARDAIGTTATVTASGRSWQRQLTAGDGFMASNQRMICFGLTADPEVADVQIRWPSGAVSRLQDVPVDSTISVTEGRSLATVFSPGGGSLQSVPVQLR